MDRYQLSCLVLFLVLLPGVVRAEVPSNAKLNQKIENVRLADAAGKPFDLHGLQEKKAVVVVTLSFECPVSNSYSSALSEMAKAYEKQGVAFVGVVCDGSPAKEVAVNAERFRFTFPVFADEKNVAADVLKAEVMPEAFVLDHNFVLRYRGRIDDGWAERLKRNVHIKSQELKSALDDLLAGRDVATPITTAIGCKVRRETSVKATTDVTYHRDVLPILQTHCQQCHRPGEVGPFSLMNYKQAVNWASDIKDYTQSRKMPPWKPVGGPAYHNERRLSDKELATLAAWADGGTPEGDPNDAPQPRDFGGGWQLGKPDLILTVPDEMHLGASGKDLFRVFVLPTGLTEDTYVTAVDVRPGNPRIVHHVLNFLDMTGKARELEKKENERKKDGDEKDRGPGYSVQMGVGFQPQGSLSGWAPGQVARHLPEGTGYLIPKGADLVMQVHYHRNGRSETDRTQVGLYLAKKPIERRFQGMVLPGQGIAGSPFFLIPANKSDFRLTGAIRVQTECDLHSVMGHMHMIGRKIKVTMTPPDGEPSTLLDIQDWDYNWQETYWLKEPLRLKEGTVLNVEAIYDNTTKNPNNPFNPPRVITFGEQTTNEMCFVFLGGTSDKPGRIRFTPLRDR